MTTENKKKIDFRTLKHKENHWNHYDYFGLYSVKNNLISYFSVPLYFFRIWKQSLWNLPFYKKCFLVDFDIDIPRETTHQNFLLIKSWKEYTGRERCRNLLIQIHGKLSHELFGIVPTLLPNTLQYFVVYAWFILLQVHWLFYSNRIKKLVIHSKDNWP